MSIQNKEKDISILFISVAVVCSMLMVWNVKIGGITAGTIALFVLALIWMVINIVLINRGQMKTRQRYSRLDIGMLVLLLYEIGQLVVTLLSTSGKEVPDYSFNLLVIGTIMLYLLMMEAPVFGRMHLDLILYAGLVVMAVLLLGYLANPRIGQSLVFWGEQSTIASYLILIATVSVLQYCLCNVRTQSYFYVMCAFVSFFLLGCNHSIVSFWIMSVTILLIPILLRPTALLWKRAMQMLFLFLFMISNMSLLTGYTGLLLVETSYDLEHSVYLDLLLALGGVLFFHYWDRIPEDVRKDRIILRRLYRLDKYLLKACFILLIVFIAGGGAWQNLDSGKMSVKALQGFAQPFVAELEQSQPFFYHCVARQGVLGVIIFIAVFLLAVERVRKVWGWDRPTGGILCVALLGIVMQLFAWEGCESVLPMAVVFLTGALVKRKSDEEPEEGIEPERDAKQSADEEPEEEKAQREEIELKKDGRCREVDAESGRGKRHREPGTESGRGKRRREDEMEPGRGKLHREDEMEPDRDNGRRKEEIRPGRDSGHRKGNMEPNRKSGRRKNIEPKEKERKDNIDIEIEDIIE